MHHIARYAPRECSFNLLGASLGSIVRSSSAIATLSSDAEAVAWLRRCLEANRNFPFAHFLLAAALAQLGEPVQARAAAEAGSALNPGFHIHAYRTNALSDNPTYLAEREHIFEGLRLAGVPET